MELKPAVVTPELASAALASEAMAAAVKLAAWIGDGRPVTDSGVLRPADVAQACAALGVELPAGKKAGSASDVAELMEPWDVAMSAGLIGLSGKRVRRIGTQDLSEDPAAALDAWLRAVTDAYGLPDAACTDCLLTLVLIAGADGDAAVADLIVTIAASNGPCPDCGEIHLGDGDEEPGEHVITALAELRQFGAVEAAGEPSGMLVRLTPLGRMLADSVSAALEPAPEDSAEAVVTRFTGLQPVAAMVFARPWLAARTPVEAARELIDVAEAGTPLVRTIAFNLARLLGPDSMPAWRERATAPGYGAYVRDWLDELGESAPVFPRDDAWLAADSLSAILGETTPELAPAALVTAIEEAGDNIPDAVKAVGESGHPDSRMLIDLLRSYAPPADTKLYQLKITLRGVGDPVVWRRVAVAGSVMLNDLHQVIQSAMGWENDHMHAFRHGRSELAGKLRLREALPRQGSRILYEYDFGDSWEHDIESEGFFGNDQGVAVPACLAGGGACPPEDCGGVWGYERLKEVVLDPDQDDEDDIRDWVGPDFDPAAFSVDQANERLAWMRPRNRTAAPLLPEVAIVRSQPRGKKSKAKRKR